MLNTFVYFIGEQHCDAVKGGCKGVKIGVAQDPLSRLKELQTGNPRKLALILTIGPMSEKQAYDAERWCHRKFRRWFVRGEWFRKGCLKQIGRIKNVDFDGCVTIWKMKDGFHKGPEIERLRAQVDVKSGWRMA